MKTKRLWIGTIASLFLLATFMSSCEDENVEVIGVCPLVISTNPADLAINVPSSQIITATFNEEMNPQTFTQASFSVGSGTAKKLASDESIKAQENTKLVVPLSGTAKKVESDKGITAGENTKVVAPISGTRKKVELEESILAQENSSVLAPISGTVSFSGVVATFTPSVPLAENTTYTCKIDDSVKDMMGNALQTDFVWTFSTGTVLVPTVASTDPPNLAVDVALDKEISAVFSMEMDPLTISTSTFTLMDGLTPIVGSVAYSGSTATFTPSSDLSLDKTYTATITVGATNIDGTSMAQPYIWTFSTGELAPTVTTTDPANLAVDVALDEVISAVFNMEMDPLTISTSTFTLMDGLTPVVGSVAYSGSTATFTPSSDLLLDKTYTATITVGAANLAGTTLTQPFIWTFDTEGLAPTVSTTDPTNLAVDVALDKVISAVFSEAMDPLTISTSTFTLMDGITPVVGSVAYSGLTATFTPSSDLLNDKTYTATITVGAANAAGTTLSQNYVWNFDTEGLPPTVSTTDPANAEIDVLYDKVVSADFSVAMDPLTISTSTFTLMDGVTPIVGSVAYTGTTATFTPSSDLPAGKTFTATITTGAQNDVGTPLANNFVWSFTTQYSLTVNAVNGTVVINPDQTGYNNGDVVEISVTADLGFTFDSWSGDALGSDNPLSVTMDANKVITANFTANPPLGPGVVDLGSAGDFAILSKSGISTTGTTLITGHIGVSPIDQTAITGFSQTMDASGTFSTSIYVVGNIYAADYTPPTPTYVSTAVSDMENALTTAMGLTTDVIVDLGGGDISGMTLAPALYKWGTGLLISNVGVTLAGGPDDTWVFQIADDFTVQDDAIITLAGGAQAKNIFWVTSKQALLGSNVDFSGNIIAQTLISLTNGTTVLGRLLSQSAVTLDASTVTKP